MRPSSPLYPTPWKPALVFSLPVGLFSVHETALVVATTLLVEAAEVLAPVVLLDRKRCQ
jgi:hypothetical protein